MFIGRSKKIKVSGVEYRIGDGIVSSNENDVYRVGQILNIYIIDGIKIYFHTKQFVTQYNSHYRAYLLEPSHEDKFVLHENLLLTTPLHIRTSAFLPCFVILPHYVH